VQNQIPLQSTTLRTKSLANFRTCLPNSRFYQYRGFMLAEDMSEQLRSSRSCKYFAQNFMNAIYLLQENWVFTNVQFTLNTITYKHSATFLRVLLIYQRATLRTKKTSLVSGVISDLLFYFSKVGRSMWLSRFYESIALGAFRVRGWV